MYVASGQAAWNCTTQSGSVHKDYVPPLESKIVRVKSPEHTSPLKMGSWKGSGPLWRALHMSVTPDLLQTLTRSGALCLDLSVAPCRRLLAWKVYKQTLLQSLSTWDRSGTTWSVPLTFHWQNRTRRSQKWMKHKGRHKYKADKQQAALLTSGEARGRSPHWVSSTERLVADISPSVKVGSRKLLETKWTRSLVNTFTLPLRNLLATSGQSHRWFCT